MHSRAEQFFGTCAKPIKFVKEMDSMLQASAVHEAISSLTEHIDEARRDYGRWIVTEDEHYEPSWSIESCFFQLLAIVEVLELRELHKMVLSEYVHFKKSNGGFATSKMGPEEPYSVCLSRLWRYVRAVESFFPKEEKTKVSKDLLQIIHDIHYVITDTDLYGGPPSNENDVHIRIEGILKCFFSDLKRKPTLTKPIKNFEPDTGIPSISTLIEYKFISRLQDVSMIADQVLADTRGYVSKDWKNFLYVIYETNRFKRENEWNDLLRESGVSRDTSIVVLSGEPLPKGKKRRQNKLKRSHGPQ